ncbi:LemA family protein [Caproiciproducens sp.]
MSPILFLAIPVVLVLIFVIWWISTGNRFRRLTVKIEESESGIDVALTKRYDTLTKMIDVCKMYAKHETDTFSNVINLRKGMSMAERGTVNGQMDALSERISVIAEAYPELRSSEQFRELQLGIREVEDHLQASRRFYNSNVSAFNQLLASFPSSAVGGRLRMTPKDFFEAETGKRQDVKIG